MPIINLYTRPGFELFNLATEAPIPTIASHNLIVDTFGESIPQLIVDNADRLGLDKGPAEAVMVLDDQFGPRARNAPDVWVAIQLTECHTRKTPCEQVRDTFIDLFNKRFLDMSVRVESLAYDIFWGPGHGYLRLNGVENRW